MSHELDAVMLCKYGRATRTGRSGEMYTFNGSDYRKYFKGQWSIPQPHEVYGFRDWEPESPKIKHIEPFMETRHPDNKDLI